MDSPLPKCKCFCQDDVGVLASYKWLLGGGGGGREPWGQKSRNSQRQQLVHPLAPRLTIRHVQCYTRGFIPYRLCSLSLYNVENRGAGQHLPVCFTGAIMMMNISTPTKQILV